MTYPNPAEALAKSIEYFDAGDRDAARYWLDVARELRAGWRDKSQGYVRSDVPDTVPKPYAEADDVIWVDERGSQYRHTEASRKHMAEDHPSTDACWHDPATIGMVPAASDATAVLNAVALDPSCAACGNELIPFEGALVHRSTYKTECEFATVGR